MHAQAAAALRDVDQPVDELGQLAGECRELVDDDCERGRHRAGVGRIRDVGQTEGSEPCLAMADLGAQRGERTSGERRTQVGDHPHRVRQFCQGLERCAALVVDQQERDAVGPVVQCERGDERSEQLALAGSGRSRHQSVWAVRPQVQVQDTVGDPAHRGVQAGGVGTPGPLVEHRRGVVQKAPIRDDVADRQVGRQCGGVDRGGVRGSVADAHRGPVEQQRRQ